MVGGCGGQVIGNGGNTLGTTGGMVRYKMKEGKEKRWRKLRIYSFKHRKYSNAK